MVLRLLIDAVHEEETRVVIAEGSRIHDFDFVTAAKKQVKGNIYLAKITRVEPSLQAAFVEYGGGKQGFLPFAEIHPDYYQIPMADRKRLMDEAEAAEESDDIAPPSPAHEQPAAEFSSDFSADEESAATPAEMPAFIEAPVHEAMPEESPVHEDGQALAHAQETPAIYSDEPAGNTSATEIHPEGSSAEASESSEIETLGNEEEAVRQSRPASFSRRYKIQEVIKRNQIVLVQVIKEERGNKGVSLTTFMSLAGRYCVLMPNSPKGGGISRKIMSGEDRRRLKEISAELKTARGMSAIIRTAGIDRTRAEIKRDYEYLVKLWESIREQTLSSTAPALIYEEGDLIKRTIRDLYTGDIEEIIIEGEEGFNQAKDFLKMLMPSHAPRVKLHQENVPLFYAYNIEEQLASMYDPMVKLRSGGYIILSPTEALISIDVNSGRSTGERNIEETATKTNLEAVSEIARQLRLRDLAGLIVIDLIDMMDSRNRRAVERALKDALKLDRAKIQLGRISPFGLLEMSRQRLRPSLSESSTMPCTHCQGRGVIRSDSSVALQIIRAAEKEAASGVFSEIKLTVTPSVALYLLNTQRDALSAVERKYDIRITTVTDGTLAHGIFRLDKVKAAQARRGNASAVMHEPVAIDHQKLMDDLPPLDENPTGEDAEILVASSEVSAAPSSHDERPQRRGRRGGRGRASGSNRPFQSRGNTHESRDMPVEAGAEADTYQHNTPRPPRPDRGERPDRGDRPGRNRRPRRWRERSNPYAEAGAGGASAPVQTPNGNGAHYAQPPSHASQPPAPPPLSQQAASAEKPKKGWWRRIVES